MLTLSSVGLLAFWIVLATRFMMMARTSSKMRDQMWILFARAKEAAEFQGPDIDHLQPMFKHMLSVDITGFILSAAAAAVEGAIVLYSLL